MDYGDPALYASTERFRMWDELAAANAVVWSPPGAGPAGFWSVFTHEDCTRVLSPKSPFTSEYGMLIGFDRTHPDRGGGRMIVATDGPKHAVLRRIIGPYLSRTAVHELNAVIRIEVDALFATIRAADSIDIATHIAPRLPAAVVCSLLGVPDSDREYLISLTDRAFASPAASGATGASQEAHTEVFLYFDDLVRAARRANGLIAALKSSSELDRDDVLINCYNLLIGGNQTTRHLIAAAFAAAATHPGVLDVLRADAAGVDAAVEELVRWASPGMHVLRVATEDLSLGTADIRAGDAVVAWIAAANRDRAVFGDPQRFDPTRSPNRHVGFGYGPHACLGAGIARLEVSALLHRLAADVRSVGIRSASPTSSNLIQGFTRLEVGIAWR